MYHLQKDNDFEFQYLTQDPSQISTIDSLDLPWNCCAEDVANNVIKLDKEGIIKVTSNITVSKAYLMKRRNMLLYNDLVNPFFEDYLENYVERYNPKYDQILVQVRRILKMNFQIGVSQKLLSICENKTFCFLASAISESKKDSNAFLFKVVASIISSASKETFSFKIIFVPSAEIC